MKKNVSKVLCIVLTLVAMALLLTSCGASQNNADALSIYELDGRVFVSNGNKSLEISSDAYLEDFEYDFSDNAAALIYIDDDDNFFYIGQDLKIEKISNDVYDAYLSANGQALVFSDDDDNYYYWKDGKEKKLGFDIEFFMSDSGDSVYYIDSDTDKLYFFDGSKSKEIKTDIRSFYDSAKLSNTNGVFYFTDGDSLYVSEKGSDPVEIYDDTERLIAITDNGDSLVFSDYSDRIYIAGKDGKYERIAANVQTYSCAQLYDAAGKDDGILLAYSKENGTYFYKQGSEPFKISSDTISSLAVYKDKIYYSVSGENEIKSVSVKGGDSKTVIEDIDYAGFSVVSADKPIWFYAYDDELYIGECGKEGKSTGFDEEFLDDSEIFALSGGVLVLYNSDEDTLYSIKSSGSTDIINEETDMVVSPSYIHIYSNVVVPANNNLYYVSDGILYSYKNGKSNEVIKDYDDFDAVNY